MKEFEGYRILLAEDEEIDREVVANLVEDLGAKCLIARNGEEYMRLMNASGRSSEELLNNIVTSATGDTKLAEGLEKSRKLLEGRGAWRVHGGGFAGCVQALMPADFFEVYKAGMEAVFGAGTCRELRLA